MERYAMVLAASLKELGCRVVFHARKADRAAAQAMGIELRCSRVARFPRKLQDFHFFRQVEKERLESTGSQITLTRVRVRDLVICGGTHRGYLRNARKLAGPFDWLQIWMEQEAYRHARVVVSHSDLCNRELAEWYSVPPEKIVTLYPPIEAKFASPADSRERGESRRNLGLPPDKVVFLFPSMGHSRKGLKPVCQAMEEFSDHAILAVAGKPVGTAEARFVRYLGYVKDMPAAYKAADFTILGSSYEPFGLVGPESVMCGTRLVFEENIGCLTAIRPEFVLTFCVWKPESIRQALSTAVALTSRRENHISEPRAALLYDPSPAEHAKALLRLL